MFMLGAIRHFDNIHSMYTPGGSTELRFRWHTVTRQLLTQQFMKTATAKVWAYNTKHRQGMCVYAPGRSIVRYALLGLL